jgi:hypothetical protein
VERFGSHGLVMFGRVVLTVIVHVIGFATFSVFDELALSYTVPDPIVSHVHGLGPTLLDTVIGNDGGSAIVGDHGGRRLRVAELFKRNALRDSYLSIIEESSGLSFRGAGDNLVEDLEAGGMLIESLSLGWGASGAGFWVGLVGVELR